MWNALAVKRARKPALVRSARSVGTGCSARSVLCGIYGYAVARKYVRENMLISARNYVRVRYHWKDMLIFSRCRVSVISASD